MDVASRLNKVSKQGSEFQSWVLVFGCFPRVLIVLGLFLLFWIGLKAVQFRFHFGDLVRFVYDCREKSDDVGGGFWLKASVVEVQTCRSGRLNWLKRNGFWFSKFNLVAKGAVVEEDIHKDENESDCEDSEFDVIKLRRLVKIERKHKEDALEELEKERMAAASAADEAMAMIFRLQHEKSAIEIRANQFRRMMEQKEQYDQEAIDCLLGIIMGYESEGSLSEQPCRSTGVGDSTGLLECDMEFILEDNDDAQVNNIDMGT